VRERDSREDVAFFTRHPAGIDLFLIRGPA
jgi:hypothetical protein